MNKKSREKNGGGGNRIWDVAKIIVLAAQAILSLILISSMITTGILKTWTILAVVVSLVVLFVLSLFFLIIKKKAKTPTQIASFVASMLVIAVSIFAVRYTSAFNSFLNKIISDGRELKEYSVYVLNDSGIDDVAQLESKNAGLLATDMTASKAEEELKKRVDVKTNTYEDIIVMDEMMDGGLLDAMVLEDSRVEAFREDWANVFDDKKVVFNFSIEIVNEEENTPQKEITEEPFLIYISGSDSRTGLKATARSDVNILAAVNPKTGKILLVSIPRDTYVQLHGTTGLKDKLTHAGVYGVEMSKMTIEDLLDVDIDYTIKVGFETVVRIVDELGGIEINSDTAMTLSAGNGKKCTYTVGKQWVDGDCALRYARERKTYRTGDLHRGANQQEVLTAIINKMSSSRDYFLRLPEIMNAASDLFETSLGEEEITEFIRMQLANQIKWQTESIAVTGRSDMLPTYSMGANLPLYVMHPDTTSLKAAHDRISEYLKQSEN